MRRLRKLGRRNARSHYRYEDFVGDPEGRRRRRPDPRHGRAAPTFAAATCKALADDGRLVQIAFLEGPKVELNFGQVMMRRLTITGSTLCPQSDAAKARHRRATGSACLCRLLSSGRNRAGDGPGLRPGGCGQGPTRGWNRGAHIREDLLLKVAGHEKLQLSVSSCRAATASPETFPPPRGISACRPSVWRRRRQGAGPAGEAFVGIQCRRTARQNSSIDSRSCRAGRQVPGKVVDPMSIDEQIGACQPAHVGAPPAAKAEARGRAADSTKHG